MFSRREVVTVTAMVLCLAYFYVVPLPLLALPGMILFAALAWSRLDVAVSLLPLTFPFWYVPKRLIDDKVFPLSEIVLAVCVALAFTQLAMILYRKPWTREPWREEMRLGIERWLGRLGPLLVAGIALLVVGVTLGVFVARRHPEALRAWRWEIAEPLVYFFLVLGFGRSQRAVALLVWSFLGSALLVALLAAGQVLWFHVTFLPIADANRLVPYLGAPGTSPRATAIIYGSANNLGTWLARALPLALALACGSSAARWVRLAAGILAAAYLPALFWSDSRGAWVAAGAASLVVVWVEWRWSRKLVLGLVAVGIVLAVWQRAALAGTLLLGHGGSGEVRTLIWLASWHMIRDHWPLGIGPDQFLYYYDPRYTPHAYLIRRLGGHITPAIYQPDIAQPHNLLLDFWLSGGLLALAGLIAILAGTAARVSRMWQNRQILFGMPLGPLALGVAASLLAGLIQGMVDNFYFSPDLALAFWWAIALLILIQRQWDRVPGDLQ
jgi:putative inorganic carbon (HCO3(-)) transporter